MPREIEIAGILEPGLLLVLIGCLSLLWGMDLLIGRLGLYRYVWHPSLFRLAVFASLFGALGLILF